MQPRRAHQYLGMSMRVHHHQELRNTNGHADKQTEDTDDLKNPSVGVREMCGMGESTQQDVIEFDAQT